MKKALVVCSLAILATGCASTGEGSYGKMIALGFISPELAGQEAVKLGLAKTATDQAVENCQRMGFRINTTAYQQCVNQQSISIRQSRDATYAAQQANRNRSVVCRPWAGGVKCDEF